MKYMHEEVAGTLVRHWANETESAEDKTSTFGIRQVETGIVYSEAVDVVPCRYTYEPTDIPIPAQDIDDAEALRIITGVIS